MDPGQFENPRTLFILFTWLSESYLPQLNFLIKFGGVITQC